MSSDLLETCYAVEDLVTEGCPHLEGLAAISACRTQTLFGLGDTLFDCSIFVGTMVLLAGLHWIKYLEMVPRLALPVLTITSTFLDLLALVRTLLRARPSDPRRRT